MLRLRLFIALAFLSCAAPQATSDDPLLPQPVRQFFRIQIVDRESRAPIAGVELTTTNHATYTSDDNGNIAFYEPGMMDRAVYFDVKRDGYARKKDGFGFSGASLTPKEAQMGVIELDRVGEPEPLSIGDDETRLLAGPVPDRTRLFQIKVVDGKTQRGVPMVEMTAGHRRHVTDSNGLVAIGEPSLLGAVNTFTLGSHGYRSKSVELEPKAGGATTIALERINIAERLYRVTGQGIYRESLLLGLPAPLARPALNAGVSGQDTTQTAVWKGKLFWIWGDTIGVNYPLGNFNATAGTSLLPAQGGLDPDLGVDLTYFETPNGFVRPMAPNTDKRGGMLWLLSLMPVKDDSGAEVLAVLYTKRSDILVSYEDGVAVFDEATSTFKSAAVFPRDQAVWPGFPAFRFGNHYHSHGSQDWWQNEVDVRIPARLSSMISPASYESFTPYLPGSTTVDRDASGRPHYAWRPGTRAPMPEDITAGRLKPDEALFGHMRDIETGEVIRAHAGDIQWNPHRRRFVRIVSQFEGASSVLGEYYYAEGDTPVGPWEHARKIITHDGPSFYNPHQHPYFAKDNGRVIYFEGTYSNYLAKKGMAPLLPRYAYNQIMYKLDLADPRLALPVPVYETNDGTLGTKEALKAGATYKRAFWAFDRAAAGTVPVRGFHAYGKQMPRTVPFKDGSKTVYVYPSETKVEVPVTDYLGE